MNIQGSVWFQKAPVQSGIPFQGADNGLATDNITGIVVLGEDEGTSSAMLLNDRQIPMDGRALSYLLDNSGDARLSLNLNNAAIYFEASNNPDAYEAFHAHAQMNGQPFEMQLGNDGVGDGTEVRTLYSAGGGQVNFQVGSAVDSVLFGDTAFLRGVGNALSFITSGDHDIITYRHNIEIERLTATQRIAHVADHILFDGISDLQNVANENTSIGWDFKNTGGTTRAFLTYNGNAGYLRIGGGDGYHPELWANNKLRMSIAAGGDVIFVDEANVVQLSISLATGVLTVASLAGVGVRPVLASAAGVLSA